MHRGPNKSIILDLDAYPKFNKIEKIFYIN